MLQVGPWQEGSGERSEGDRPLTCDWRAAADQVGLDRPTHSPVPCAQARISLIWIVRIFGSSQEFADDRRARPARGPECLCSRLARGRRSGRRSVRTARWPVTGAPPRDQVGPVEPPLTVLCPAPRLASSLIWMSGFSERQEFARRPAPFYPHVA